MARVGGVTLPARLRYWLTGFTNAQGFLTGMRQEVTRQHKKDQWALDDVVNFTEVMPSAFCAVVGKEACVFRK